MDGSTDESRKDKKFHPPPRAHVHFVSSMFGWWLGLLLAMNRRKLYGIIDLSSSPQKTKVGVTEFQDWVASHGLEYSNNPRVDWQVDDASLVVCTLRQEEDDDCLRIDDISFETYAAVARHLWTNYRIDGDLGTEMALKKYPLPQPSTPSTIAAHEGRTHDIVDIHTPDDSGNTPLIWAANAGRLETVHYLVKQRSVDMNVRGYLGATAAGRAARCGHVNVLQVLQGADWDICNDKRQYPLHFAAFKQHLECTQVLLEHSANPYVLDRKGRTPSMDTANDEIRMLIESYMQ